MTVAEEEMFGCELPPAHVDGSAQATHCPEFPAQKTVPRFVLACPKRHEQATGWAVAPVQ